MSRLIKIPHNYGPCLMGINKHKAGYWGNHAAKNDGWIGYVIAFGILIVSFFTLILLG